MNLSSLSGSSKGTDFSFLGTFLAPEAGATISNDLSYGVDASLVL
jgi:hypothetical protein